MLTPRILPATISNLRRMPRRAPRTSPKGRSLVNCNHLATSESKSVQRESVADEFNRRNAKRLETARKMALRKQLLRSLEVIAVREEGLDALRRTQEALEGAYNLPDPETGPWSAARDYNRLFDCHSQFLGLRPQCCNGAAYAVPINCNHRLCPLCNSSRLEQYRGKAREMLDSMKNPTFLTLTVPNVETLTKATFSWIRGAWKAFRKEIELVGGKDSGGVYSIEVTFNREERTWHPHLHILFDSPYRIALSPSKFRLLKRRLEFAWLMSTDSSAGKRFPMPKASRKANLGQRKNARFLAWNEETAHHPKGDPWNQKNRRVVDLRNVEDGDGAVYEVIKYISKSNRFLDVPEAVERYLRAVRGVRIIQTFGTFYKFKFPENVEHTVKVSCPCGTNDYVHAGVFGLGNVYQSESGTWFLKHVHQQQAGCRSGPT
jgi:hypothetical protein